VQTRLDKLGFSVFWMALIVSAGFDATAQQAGRKAEADSCTIYSFIASDGELVKTISPESVPPAYRAAVMTVVDCGEAKTLAARGGVETKAPPPEALRRAAAAPAERPVPVGETGRRYRASRALGWFSALPSWKALLLILCAAANLAGGIGILVLAFRTSIWWGLGCIIPLVDLIFVIIYWRDTWPVFTASLLGSLGTMFLIWVA
jgi:hypothetical protein